MHWSVLTPTFPTTSHSPPPRAPYSCCCCGAFVLSEINWANHSVKTAKNGLVGGCPYLKQMYAWLWLLAHVVTIQYSERAKINRVDEGTNIKLRVSLNLIFLNCVPDGSACRRAYVSMGGRVCRGHVAASQWNAQNIDTQNSFGDPERQSTQPPLHVRPHARTASKRVNESAKRDNISNALFTQHDAAFILRASVRFTPGWTSLCKRNTIWDIKVRLSVCLERRVISAFGGVLLPSR